MSEDIDSKEEKVDMLERIMNDIVIEEEEFIDRNIDINALKAQNAVDIDRNDYRRCVYEEERVKNETNLNGALMDMDVVNEDELVNAVHNNLKDIDDDEERQCTLNEEQIVRSVVHDDVDDDDGCNTSDGRIANEQNIPHIVVQVPSTKSLLGRELTVDDGGGDDVDKSDSSNCVSTIDEHLTEAVAIDKLDDSSLLKKIMEKNVFIHLDDATPDFDLTQLKDKFAVLGLDTDEPTLIMDDLDFTGTWIDTQSTMMMFVEVDLSENQKCTEEICPETTRCIKYDGMASDMLDMKMIITHKK